MSNPSPQSNVVSVFSSGRDFVEEPKLEQTSTGNRALAEKLLLGPQLRVEVPDVFLLRPEFAVPTASKLQQLEKPQNAKSAVGAVKKNEPKPEPLLLTAEMAQNAAPKDSNAKDLAAKIAALETAIAKTVDQWEPDGLGRDAYAGKSMPSINWKDNVELDPTGKPVSSDTAQENGATKTSTEAHSVDADVIRELVKEIIRSELRGALGEQITKHMRTLVRQEIHRVLAARSQQ